MLLALLVTSASSVAQEEADFGGTWDSVFTGEIPRGRCGQEQTFSQLQVTGQVPDTKWPTYEAIVTAWISTQRCLETVRESGKARLVVRGTRVSLSYEDEYRGAEMLVRDGNKMAGIDADGVSVEWVQPGELPVSLQTAMVRQNIITATKGPKLDELKAKFAAIGLSDEAVEQLVPKLVEGFADCAVGVIQVQAAVQRLPYDELLKMYDPISEDVANPRVARKLDRVAVEARMKSCVYEVSKKPGIQDE
jgi:hypothetical protein